MESIKELLTPGMLKTLAAGAGILVCVLLLYAYFEIKKNIKLKRKENGESN